MKMGYLTSFHGDSHQKELNKRRIKVQNLNFMRSADRLEVESEVACDLIKFVILPNSTDSDVTSNLELNFWSIDWSHKIVALNFAS